MGWETVIFLGLSALSANTEIKNSKRQAEAIIEEGNLEAENKGQEVRLRAARLQSSFLNSGLTLEGTPMNVIDSVYSSGIKDIQQIRQNYGRRAENVLDGGRSAAISTMAKGVGNAAIGSGGFDDMFSGARNSWSNVTYGLERFNEPGGFWGGYNTGVAADDLINSNPGGIF